MSLHCRVQLARRGFSLDAELTTEGARLVALVGASGSGKTTLLRCVAGLERGAAGEIRFAGETWQSGRAFVKPHRRPIGYVFQEPSLFPHLDVRRNLEYGLRRVPHNERLLQLDEVVDLLGVERMLSRAPESLSGGERQRVAMARALLSSPKLLLLDEPLASLDIESRAQIIPYLAAIRRRLAIPVLYVTHAPSEVARLADEVAYLSAGRVVAHGPINEMLTRSDLPLCRLEDAGAAVDATVVRHEARYHLMHLCAGSAELCVSQRKLPVGATVRLFIRARDVSLTTGEYAPPGIQNTLACRILDVLAERDPAHRLVRLQSDSGVLLSRVTQKTVEQLRLRAGAHVLAQVKAAALAD